MDLAQRVFWGVAANTCYSRAGTLGHSCLCELVTLLEARALGFCHSASTLDPAASHSAFWDCGARAQEAAGVCVDSGSHGTTLGPFGVFCKVGARGRQSADRWWSVSQPRRRRSGRMARRRLQQRSPPLAELLRRRVPWRLSSAVIIGPRNPAITQHATIDHFHVLKGNIASTCALFSQGGTYRRSVAPAVLRAFSLFVGSVSSR